MKNFFNSPEGRYLLLLRGTQAEVLRCLAPGVQCSISPQNLAAARKELAAQEAEFGLSDADAERINNATTVADLDAIYRDIDVKRRGRDLADGLSTQNTEFARELSAAIANQPPQVRELIYQDLGNNGADRPVSSFLNDLFPESLADSL